MIGMPDVNVLVALAWPNHVHHEAARNWFDASHRDGWATCPLTESGFVRVSANRRVMPIATTPQQAIELLRRMTGLEGHTFWTDETSIARSRWIAAQKLVGHGQVTDAHLLAVTLGHGGRLVTFDGAISEILPAAASKDVLLVLRA
jgi:hypothetical protein